MYFEKAGPTNTAQAVAAAVKAAQEQNIKHIVVASSTGETALLLRGTGKNVVCVTVVGTPMTDETRHVLDNEGIRVLTCTHALSGAERGLSRKFGGVHPVEIIAHTLRMLGQGVKVCVEVAVMALDAGLIPKGEKVVALGGSGRGCDTAVVVTPGHASGIFETKIHQILCKPALE